MLPAKALRMYAITTHDKVSYFSFVLMHINEGHLIATYLEELIIVFFQCYEIPFYSCVESKVPSYNFQMENTTVFAIL